MPFHKSPLLLFKPFLGTFSSVCGGKSLKQHRKYHISKVWAFPLARFPCRSNQCNLVLIVDVRTLIPIAASLSCRAYDEMLWFYIKLCALTLYLKGHSVLDMMTTSTSLENTKQFYGLLRCDKFSGVLFHNAFHGMNFFSRYCTVYDCLTGDKGKTT